MRWLLMALMLLGSAAHAEPDDAVRIDRGRQLAIIGDCVACHTSANGQPFAGGRGIATPFGLINSANLTPDLTTGIGSWTEVDFARAMHDGISPGGMHLYPAFPYPFYTRITRADSNAIFAFLRSLPATVNPVDRSTLPFPLDIRASMIGWNALFFTPGTWKPDPARSPAYNRGAYLVEGLAHCGACHTPMNILGGSKGSQAFQGNMIQDWWAPNITNDKHAGLGSWSVDELVEYLQTGRTVHAAATGPMAEVVAYSTSKMSADDVRAMATYLKERETTDTARPTSLARNDATMQAGAAIYRDTCSACHAADGSGVARLFPRLAGSAAVQQANPADLVRIVLGGGRAVATTVAPTAPAMPALGWRLTDTQTAAVATYIRNAWGNAAPSVLPSDVASMRETLAGR